MNKETIAKIKVIAQRMILESRMDNQHTYITEEAEEAYCAGCKKMRDAMEILLLLQEFEAECENYVFICEFEEEDARLGYLN